jgi:hypothetical protein
LPKAEDVADPVALAPGHGFMPGIVAVAAHQDLHPGPAGADRLADVAQDESDLGAGRCLAWPEDHRERLAAGRLVEVDRQEAAAVVVGVEQRELLAAIDPVRGVVDVEHEASGQVVEAVAEQLDHGRHHALERDRAGQVLEPAHGRLGAQVSRALGQPADRHLEGRVGTQGIAVVGILVADRDQQGHRASPVAGGAGG